MRKLAILLALLLAASASGQPITRIPASKIYVTDLATDVETALSGDKIVGALGCTNGQVPVWSTGNAKWECGAGGGGSQTPWTGNVDAAGFSWTFDDTGDGLPSTLGAIEIRTENSNKGIHLDSMANGTPGKHAGPFLWSYHDPATDLSTVGGYLNNAGHLILRTTLNVSGFSESFPNCQFIPGGDPTLCNLRSADFGVTYADGETGQTMFGVWSDTDSPSILARQGGANTAVFAGATNAGAETFRIDATGWWRSAPTTATLKAGYGTWYTKDTGGTEYRPFFMDEDGVEYDLSAGVPGHAIADEAGAPLPQEATLDFVGAGVTATPGSGKTIVTIPGGVTGPGGATNKAIARFNGAGGGTIQDSSVLIEDDWDITGVKDFTASGTITGETFSATGATEANYGLDLNEVTSTPSAATAQHIKVVNHNNVLTQQETTVLSPILYRNTTDATFGDNKILLGGPDGVNHVTGSTMTFNDAKTVLGAKAVELLEFVGVPDTATGTAVKLVNDDGVLKRQELTVLSSIPSVVDVDTVGLVAAVAQNANVNIGTEIITSDAAHGWSDDDGPFNITSTGTVNFAAAGWAYGTPVYVNVTGASTFGISLTAGAANIDITAAGDGVHTFTPITQSTDNAVCAWDGTTGEFLHARADLPTVADTGAMTVYDRINAGFINLGRDNISPSVGDTKRGVAIKSVTGTPAATTANFLTYTVKNMQPAIVGVIGPSAGTQAQLNRILVGFPAAASAGLTMTAETVMVSSLDQNTGDLACAFSGRACVMVLDFGGSTPTAGDIWTTTAKTWRACDTGIVASYWFQSYCSTPIP